MTTRQELEGMLQGGEEEGRGIAGGEKGSEGDNRGGEEEAEAVAGEGVATAGKGAVNRQIRAGRPAGD